MPDVVVRSPTEQACALLSRPRVTYRHLAAVLGVSVGVMNEILNGADVPEAVRVLSELQHLWLNPDELESVEFLRPSVIVRPLGHRLTVWQWLLLDTLGEG
jgi:hypothetical protein